MKNLAIKRISLPLIAFLICLSGSISAQNIVDKKLDPPIYVFITLTNYTYNEKAFLLEQAQDNSVFPEYRPLYQGSITGVPRPTNPNEAYLPAPQTIPIYQLWNIDGQCRIRITTSDGNSKVIPVFRHISGAALNISININFSGDISYTTRL